MGRVGDSSGCSGVSSRLVAALGVGLLALAVALGGCSSTEGTAEPGDECEEEGERDGDLVCEDGTWVEDPIDQDAGVDADDGECQPETHEEFCERHDVECGSFSGLDNCDQERNVHCEDFDGFGCEGVGTCTHASEDEDLETNVCECPELEGDPAEEICDYADVECGTIEAGEVCSGWDDLGEIECGECEEEGVECGSDIDNVCGCPCEIDDTCYADGQTAPDEECLVCDSEQDDEEFTEVEDGTECEEGGVCQDGECVCEEGTDCDDECVDTETNDEHCGECGNECEDGEVCDGGTCVTSCEDDETLCEGECVDTETNDDHCGECGEECETDVDGAEPVCEDGECGEECVADDEEICDDECTNTDNDRDNCGECGEECGVNEVCRDGDCEGGLGDDCNDDGDCPPTSECCDGECLDPTDTCNGNGD